MISAEQELGDAHARTEAAMLYAGGDTKAATNLLIQRINDTGGYCDTRLWLMAFDIYKTQKQKAAYERLAIYFSDRFRFSAPGWEDEALVSGKNSGRNALVMDGSPSGANDGKIRDFILCASESGGGRLDLSRVTLAESDPLRRKDVEKILDIMRRLRRYGCRVLLMGDSELTDQMSQRVEGGGSNMSSEQPYWLLLFEIFQWRGMESEFDALAMRFADRFSYCPVGYDPHGVIAIAPSSDTDQDLHRFGYASAETISDGGVIIDWIKHEWDHGHTADIYMYHTHRMSADAARQIQPCRAFLFQPWAFTHERWLSRH